MALGLTQPLTEMSTRNISLEVCTFLYFHFQIFRTKLMFIFFTILSVRPNNEYLEGLCYIKLLTRFESLNKPLGVAVLFLKHIVHKPTVNRKLLK